MKFGMKRTTEMFAVFGKVRAEEEKRRNRLEAC